MFKLFNSLYKNSYNFMPLCFSYLAVFPNYLEYFGYQPALLTILVAYLFVCLEKSYSEGEKKECYWKIGPWFKLLTLISRLALCCSWLGRLLASYHGSEQTIYHFFPQMPWIMSITVSLGTTFFIVLGLQPAPILKLVFHLIFGSLFLTFAVLSGFKVWQEFTSVTVDLNILGKVPTGIIFFLGPLIIEANGRMATDKSDIKGQTCLNLLTMAVIVVFNEKVVCSSIGKCITQYFEWYEPIYLALCVSCLGLCLPDFFTAASDFLKASPMIGDMLAVPFNKINLSSPIAVGSICSCMVYFCSPTMLIMISGTSLLLELTIYDLNSINASTSSCAMHDNNENGGNAYRNLENGENDNSLSDTDSGSDIDAIVEEYLSQIHVVSGMNLATETYLRSTSYLFKMILVTITICSYLLSLAVQSKLHILSSSLVIGTISLMILLQWASKKHALMLGRPVPAVLQRSLMYSKNIFVLGFLPLNVWPYIIIWLLKGGVMSAVSTSLKKLDKRTETRQVFSIRESPPVFGTSCSKNNTTNKKIIHA